jgi:hypothetical protein
MLVLRLLLAWLGSPTLGVTPEADDCPCCDDLEECPIRP